MIFDQQVTGVTVSKGGRIFVNFPRWEADVAISVAELVDGKPVAYPDAAWNAYRNAQAENAADSFVCVQSVVVGPNEQLWVLDPGAPGTEFVVPGGPKLVRIDLATNKVAQVIRFPMTAAPQGSYLNDVRFAPDGSTAYITDSGTRGGIVVVDLRSGAARRAVDAIPQVLPEKGVVPHGQGWEAKRPDGRRAAFASDGIALDPKGETLYFQALTGKTLYAVPTQALRDAKLPQAKLVAQIRQVGTTCVTDGMLMDRKGQLYLTSPEDDSVKRREADGSLHIVAQGARLRWPDTLAEGPDGKIYVTASCLQDMARWQTDGVKKVQPWALYRFMPA